MFLFYIKSAKQSGEQWDAGSTSWEQAAMWADAIWDATWDVATIWS